MPKTYVVNTNQKHNPNSELDMLKNEKCAAYYSPWKYDINEIEANDIIFLYSSGKGIIARGIATGIPEIADYEGNPDEEYYMNLNRFQVMEKPFPASELTRIVDHEIRYAQTIISLTYKNGIDLWQEITKKYI